MRLPIPRNLHLTYCTNIHPADGWEAVYANVRRYAPALKARFAPDIPFGIGLRLSARDARELLSGDRLDGFRTYLHEHGLYVAVINGFPYGPFHGTPVKASVYAPDWRDDARVQYTLDLIRILRAVLPAGLDGGVSTAPLSYKAWLLPEPADAAWERITTNVVRVAEALVRARQVDGTRMHLDIEPEPDCSIENTQETLDFFERHLLPRGAPQLARALGMTDEEAAAALLEHVRICFDCCHFAVEFEEPVEAIQRLTAAGIKIGRVQLSSAIDVDFSDPSADAPSLLERLRRFADTTYLHQVVERHQGRLRRFPDLPEALVANGTGGGSGRWRVHFHVPLFTQEYERLGSTQGYVSQVLQHVLRTGITTHLEIETYTWDVLPEGLKADLLGSIGREYEWVLHEAGLPGARGGSAGR